MDATQYALLMDEIATKVYQLKGIPGDSLLIGLTTAATRARFSEDVDGEQTALKTAAAYAIARLVSISGDTAEAAQNVETVLRNFISEYYPALQLARWHIELEPKASE